MKLTCIGTGSSGNSFILNDNGNLLILDAGVKFDKLLAAKSLTSFSRVAGALVTHEHKDHSLCVPALRKAGINVYSPKNLRVGKKYNVGNFDVLPFQCYHDVINYGYVIRCPTGQVIVYATDTALLPPIRGVDVWLVECNYTETLWRENLEKSTTGFRYFGRVKECHMGLETLQRYFSARKAPATAIILCHLSENGNADSKAIKEALTPYAMQTDIADAGKEWVIV